MSRWFRFYDEALNDPRLQLLPDRYFKTYIRLMCAVSMWRPEIVDDEQLHEFIRVSKRHLKSALALFREQGLLTEDGLKHFSRPASNRAAAAEWAVLRSSVFARDNYTCTYCGERGGKLECDHVIPHSRGGADDLSNLVTACFACNRSKRDKTPEEWIGNGSHSNH